MYVVGNHGMVEANHQGVVWNWGQHVGEADSEVEHVQRERK
jgi:hypothetical protein